MVIITLIWLSISGKVTLLPIFYGFSSAVHTSWQKYKNSSEEIEVSVEWNERRSSNDSSINYVLKYFVCALCLLIGD